MSKVGSIRQPRPVVSPKKKTLTGTIDDLGEQIRRDIAPKPHFLRQLENFMESELVALGCQDSRPTAARLQVFQQCFQHFIDEFKTYRGFLYRIKNEYDSLVDRYADQLHYLAPLEMRLTTLEHEREQQLKQRDIRHNQVVQELKHSLTQTQARLGQYAASNALLVEEKTQVEDACKTASENYEQMLSTNKTLVAALKREEEGTARREKKENEYQHSYLSCKNALEKAQDEIERLKQQSIILQEAQAQMISIDVANERAATIKQMNKTISDLNHANQQLKDEKRKLVDTIQDITARRLDDATIAANVTNTSHLIPNEIITGTENECQQPVITDSLHDTIEQRGSAESSEVDQGFEPPGNYFVCKDDGPSYLRYDGLVRNIRLSKRTTERIIGDCWKQKEASEKSSNQTIALEDYFYRYLKVKFGSDANIAEWGNNVVSALETYAYDSDCRIFQAILQGEVAEGVRVEQLRMLYRVYEAMVSADKIENVRILSRAQSNVLTPLEWSNNWKVAISRFYATDSTYFPR